MSFSASPNHQPEAPTRVGLNTVIATMTAAISDNLQQRLWSVNRSSTFHRFSYEPLPIASAFRVMELLPGTRQDPVKINILTASWTSHLPYEPISYVWGDATDVQEYVYLVAL